MTPRRPVENASIPRAGAASTVLRGVVVPGAVVPGTRVRIAVVTGAARGIGRQIAFDLLAAGYRVIIGDLQLKETAVTAGELGERCSAVRLDVTDRKAIAKVVADVEKSVGPIDVWVNNAGIMPTGPFLGQDLDVAEKVIDVNYVGVVQTTGILLPLMVARGTGTILNIASATGAKPLAGAAVYSGTKAAIIAFSDAVRREVRNTGVTICVVLPNLARTRMSSGIVGPAVLGSVSAEQVSKVVLRALHTGRFESFVPRRLGPVIRLSRLLSTGAQDWLDDRIGTDRIGLGGDPGARAAYLDEVLAKER
jgi:short-subunit dehydrogenase